MAGPRDKERRCIATGITGSAAEMIRFVAGPDDQVVPDVDGDLPGRGFWLSARRDVVETAQKKNLFAKAARKRVTIPADLADRVEALLVHRCRSLLGLARRAGLVIVGYEKVRAELKGGRGVLLLAAADGAPGGRTKIRALAPSLPLQEALTSVELGSALGREGAVHVVVKQGRLADSLRLEMERLALYRGGGSDNGTPVAEGAPE